DGPDEPITRLHHTAVPSWSWASMSTRGKRLYLAGTDRPPGETFVADKSFDFVEVSYRPHAGSCGDEFMAQCWTLRLKGCLILAKISVERSHNSKFSGYLVAPANYAHFPSTAIPLEPGWLPMMATSATVSTSGARAVRLPCDAGFMPDCARW